MDALSNRTGRTVVARNERGSANMSTLQPGVLLYICSGHFTGDLYEPMVVPAEDMMKRNGSVIMFVDGWELTSIDTRYREAWTAWFKEHRDRFRMNLLVRTKLMEMAASLANLFTGVSVISTYSSVEAWERACAKDVGGFQKTR